MSHHQYQYQLQVNPENGNPAFLQFQAAESNIYTPVPHSNVRRDFVGSIPPASVNNTASPLPNATEPPALCSLEDFLGIPGGTFTPRNGTATDNLRQSDTITPRPNLANPQPKKRKLNGNEVNQIARTTAGDKHQAIHCSQAATAPATSLAPAGPLPAGPIPSQTPNHNPSSVPAPPAQMLRDLREKSVTELRGLQVEFGKGKRLTKEIKDELREITLDYQKKVHILAIQHEMHAHLLLKWLGAYNQSRGPNRFNSFCAYGPEARKIFDSKELPPGERMQVVAEIWRSMDEDERLQYDDWGFLNSLRAQMGLKPLKNGIDDGEDDEQSDDEDRVIASAATMKHCTKWANTAIEQMNHMHAVHQVEGFFVLASTDVEGTVFKVGGSVLGESYVQLLRERNDPWKQFRVWASGIAAHARLSGLPVGPPKIGSRKREAQGPWDLLDVHKNRKSMTDQLRARLETVTRGVRTKGWPGTDTLRYLNSWGVTVELKPEAKLDIKDVCKPTKTFPSGTILRVLEALHRGWFQIKLLDQNDNAASVPASVPGSPQEKSATTSQGRKVHNNQDIGKEHEDVSTAEDNNDNDNYSEEEDTDCDL